MHRDHKKRQRSCAQGSDLASVQVRHIGSLLNIASTATLFSTRPSCWSLCTSTCGKARASRSRRLMLSRGGNDHAFLQGEHTIIIVYVFGSVPASYSPARFSHSSLKLAKMHVSVTVYILLSLSFCQSARQVTQSHRFQHGLQPVFRSVLRHVLRLLCFSSSSRI